jgi:hypothetical protein
MKQHVLNLGNKYHPYHWPWTDKNHPATEVRAGSSKETDAKKQNQKEGYSTIWTLCLDLFMKEASLFCFVCLAEISQTRAFHLALCVSSESSQWVGVHWLGWERLKLWCRSYWLSNHFLTEKIKSKLRIVWEFGCVLGIIRKLSLSLGFNRVYFTIFRPKV